MNLKELLQKNTTKPLLVRNKIKSMLDFLDEMPGCGQVIQILILQGLIVWFENCDINEGDKSYKEAESQANWIYEQLMKVCVFYFLNFKKDENSKPLDDYLATTEIGKAWEQRSLEANLEEPIEADDDLVNNNAPNLPVAMQPDNAPLSNNAQKFEYNSEKITAIHGFCNGTVFKDVSLHEFGEYVAQANFSALHKKKGTIKCKLKYIICIISHSIEDVGWYQQAATSIKTTPSKCSGANISDDTWKNQANALK